MEVSAGSVSGGCWGNVRNGQPCRVWSSIGLSTRLPLIGSIRFHQLAQIRFSTARQHRLTDGIAQAQYRLKISSAGLEWIEYFNLDVPPAGKPLVTSKN